MRAKLSIPHFLVFLCSLPATGCLATLHAPPREASRPLTGSPASTPFATPTTPVTQGNRYAQTSPQFGALQLPSTQPRFFKQITPTAWRTRVPAVQLFPLIVRSLSESYIVRKSDNRIMTVQTDWDKFFLGGRLFRNRLSVSLFQVSRQEAELVINNKVEYFQQESENKAFGESDWIPTQDITNEKEQLITSLSHVLHSISLSAHSHGRR